LKTEAAVPRAPHIPRNPRRLNISDLLGIQIHLFNSNVGGSIVFGLKDVKAKSDN
jgi:hypothetical protein